MVYIDPRANNRSEANQMGRCGNFLKDGNQLLFKTVLGLNDVH